MRRAVIPEPRGRLDAPVGLVTLMEGLTMGTTWSVQVAGLTPNPDRLRSAVQAALDSVVAQMSHWAPDSEISRYNRAAPGDEPVISPDFVRVVACALEIAGLTDGAFDPTLGEAAEAWGFGPSLTVTESAGRHGGGAWRDLRLTENRLLQPGGAHLDLSAIAKGYAVDKVARLLVDHGFKAFLVEVGGELYGTGLTPDGGPWWVQVEWPAAVADQEIFVALPGWAIATSGDYRRFLEQDGRRFGHTLDPASGLPIASRVASVTVLAADCMRADAWATALTVMGEEAGLAFADAHDLAALFLLADEGRVTPRASAAWESLWA